MTRDASYEAWIDWYGIEGLALGCGTWSATSGVVSPPTVTKVTDPVYFGDRSYEIAFPSRGSIAFFTFDTGPGFDNGTFADTTSAEATINVAPPTHSPARYSVWVYPQQTFDIKLEVSSDAGTTESSDQTVTAGTWNEVTLVRPASYAVPKYADTTVRLIPMTPDNVTLHVGLIQVVKDYSGARPAENITGKILSDRQEPSITYGKDEAHDLAQVKAGSVDILLNNALGEYTPPSDLVDYSSQRQVAIRVRTDSGKYNNIYVGWTDEFTLDADIQERAVSVTTADQLSRAEKLKSSTDLYPSIKTGAAIKAILDSAGLPYDDDDIDTGATILTWWSFNGDAMDGIRELVNAEGPPATYTINGSGQFIFHDRHHRVRSSYNADPVYTVVAKEDDIVDPETDFVFLKGTTLERGKSTIINQVNTKARRGRVSDEISTVWTAPEKTYTFSGKKTFTANIEGGFWDGQEPVKGELTLADSPGLDDNEMTVSTVMRLSRYDPENQDADVTEPDFVVESGSVYVDEYATSGSKVEITLVARGEATIRDLQFRARAVVYEEVEATLDDTYSQARHGICPVDHEGNLASPNDAEGIRQYIIDHNKSIRPRAKINLINKTEALLDKIVGTDLGQTVRVKASTHWGTDADFAVEGLQHQLKQQGKEHRFTVYAEQVQPESMVMNEFQFDQAGHGFDFGVFSAGETLNSFTFDDGPGFDSGVFADSARVTNIPFILGESQLDSDAEVWY